MCSWTWFSYILLQLLPTLSIVLLDDQLLILRQLHCHVHVSGFFYPVEFNRAKKPTLEGSAWISLFNFTLLIFRTKQGPWHKRIHLMKGSDFPSTKQLETRSDLSMARNILLAIHHFHTYSFKRITSNEPVCFEGWKKFSVPIWYPENQIWHTDNTYLSQKDKAIFFLCWSSFRSEFSNHRQNTGFGDKSIVFLHFRENLGLGQACYQSTAISRMSFFSQWYFPSSEQSTNENLWEIVASSPFLGPLRQHRSLARSCMASFAHTNRRPCSQAITVLDLSLSRSTSSQLAFHTVSQERCLIIQLVDK